MLNSRCRGYAVMTRELDAYSFEDESLESCKRYCRKDCVIVEMIPTPCGFNLRAWYSPANLGFGYDKYAGMLRLWHLHFQVTKEYRHKIGKIVFDPKAQ